MGLHITSFCWCMGLEVGARFVGAAHLIVALILVVVSSVYAQEFSGYAGTVVDAGDSVYSIYYRMAVGGAILSVVHVLLAFTLLYSVLKRKTAGLRVWVYVMVALEAAALVLVVVMTALHGVSDSGSDIFLALLEAVLFFGVIAYCILAVYSYYLMLKCSEDMEGPNKVDY